VLVVGAALIGATAALAVVKGCPNEKDGLEGVDMFEIPFLLHLIKSARFYVRKSF
jgi:hypothetical protein